MRQTRDISSGPHRVIHLAKHCGYGNGNVHAAVDLACVQASAGYEVMFASAGGTFVGMLERHGVRHVTLLQDQHRPLRAAYSVLALVRLVRRFRPDVLHAHMMGGAAIGYVVSLLTGVRLVTTAHNSFDPHAFLMRLGHRVVSVSSADREFLIRRGFPPAKVKVVWNASINSPRDAFLPNTRPIAIQTPAIIAVCGLHPRKGLADLIAACSLIFAEFPDWRLYLAGEGPERAALEAQAASCGLAERVIFLGFVESPRQLYRAADIFVLCSYADTGSLTIGEARSAGCAIIATAVGGTPELLEHGAAGRLVPPGAPDQLARELAQLMRDSAARKALGRAGLAGADVFKVERLVGDYARVYREAMAGA